MGFFSWLTADSGESIANIHSRHPNAGRTVHLLQPGGRAPIAQPGYEGYGVFGGVDAFEWLARTNLQHAGVGSAFTADELRQLGVAIDCGRLYEDKRGILWQCRLHRASLLEHLAAVGERLADVRYFANYDEPITIDSRSTPNHYLESGQWRVRALRDLIPDVRLLKFSFDEHAQYDALSPSPECPAQGYFF